MTAVHAAVTTAKGIAISKPRNKHMIIAPEAIGIPKIIDEGEIAKVEFCVSVSDNGADTLASSRIVISVQAINIRFLL